MKTEDDEDDGVSKRWGEENMKIEEKEKRERMLGDGRERM